MTGTAIICFVVIVLAAALRALVQGRAPDEPRTRLTRTPLPLLGHPEQTLDLAGAARRAGSAGRGRAARPLL